MNDDNLMERVAAWREAAQAGSPPAPEELRAAIRAARDRAQALARSLGLEAGGGAPAGPADPAALAAYEAAIAVCLQLGQLGLDLTRGFGPDYLFDLPEPRP